MFCKLSSFFVTNVSWNALTGVTLAGISSYDETWFAFDSSGALVQQNSAWTQSQYESQIPIGAVYHIGYSSVGLVKNYPHVSYGQSAQFDPFIRAFGGLKLSGHEISSNGANLFVNRSSGSAYVMGRNYEVDPNNPTSKAISELLAVAEQLAFSLYSVNRSAVNKQALTNIMTTIESVAIMQ